MQKGLGLTPEQATQLGGMVTGGQRPERAGRLPNGDSFLITFQKDRNEDGNHYRYYSVSSQGVQEQKLADEANFRGSGTYLTLSNGQKVSIGKAGVRVGEDAAVEHFYRDQF